MSEHRPLVLLDVDGVLHDRESRDRLRFADDPDALAAEIGVAWVAIHGRRMAIPEPMPSIVRALVGMADVWWCTTWMDRANDGLADHLGIEPLPVVGAGSRPSGRAWKEAAARPLIERAIADGRSVYWIEDFDGNLPDIEGVTWIDTTDRGHLDATDLPVALRS